MFWSYSAIGEHSTTAIYLMVVTIQPYLWCANTKIQLKSFARLTYIAIYSFACQEHVHYSNASSIIIRHDHTTSTDIRHWVLLNQIMTNAYTKNKSNAPRFWRVSTYLFNSFHIENTSIFRSSLEISINHGAEFTMQCISCVSDSMCSWKYFRKNHDDRVICSRFVPNVLLIKRFKFSFRLNLCRSFQSKRSIPLVLH